MYIPFWRGYYTCCRNAQNRSNYELFKHSNFCICLWRLVLPRLLAPDLPSTSSSTVLLQLFHSNYKPLGFILLFFVTTSPCWDWVICVPAAFLGCSSRFSGSFSGIEPWFPVTRHNHSSPLHYYIVDGSEARKLCPPALRHLGSLQLLWFIVDAHLFREARWILAKALPRLIKAAICMH